MTFFENDGYLVLAEHAIAACALAAAAGAAGGAGWKRRGMRAGSPFGDGARASADEAMDLSTALGALRQRCIGHLLALLEAACTGITSVFVGGHGFYLFHSL